MTLLIHADNLTILRGQTPIVRRLNLHIHAGEALHLHGDNGSGKTTLLQALAGLLIPQGGSINRHSELLYLGHRPGVKAELTVWENLHLAAKLYHHMSHTHLNERIEYAIAQVGLSHQRDRQTRYLSAGQQRRCQLARLWLDTPILWLLDEPLTALDIHVVSRLSECCADHLKKGGSIIFTSHQPFTIPNYSVSTLSLSEQI